MCLKNNRVSLKTTVSADVEDPRFIEKRSLYITANDLSELDCEIKRIDSLIEKMVFNEPTIISEREGEKESDYIEIINYADRKRSELIKRGVSMLTFIKDGEKIYLNQNKKANLFELIMMFEFIKKINKK